MGDGLVIVITLPTTLTKLAKKIFAMMVLIIYTIILLTTLTKTAKAVLAVMVTIGTTGN